MIDRVKEYLEQVETFSSSNPEETEAFRVSYAGKKGILNDLFAAFREVPAEEKKAYGQGKTTSVSIPKRGFQNAH
jgi:phenylalanyl-tRNA synthetase alpha chain